MLRLTPRQIPPHLATVVAATTAAAPATAVVEAVEA
jgi:hypothetical protein